MMNWKCWKLVLSRGVGKALLCTQGRAEPNRWPPVDTDAVRPKGAQDPAPPVSSQVVLTLLEQHCSGRVQLGFSPPVDKTSSEFRWHDLDCLSFSIGQLCRSIITYL